MGDLTSSLLSRYTSSLFVIVFGWFYRHWLDVCLGIVIFLVVTTLLNRLFSSCLYAMYKILFGYRPTLRNMRDMLEDDYGELWNRPDFCLAYLKLHDAYQELLLTARSDRQGKLQRNTRYDEFTEVHI